MMGPLEEEVAADRACTFAAAGGLKEAHRPAPRYVDLRLTPAQANVVNAALAAYEAEVEIMEEDEVRGGAGRELALIRRTRIRVHDLLDDNGIRR